ncbi:MAG: oxidoreductase of aldo/keto reductase family, subgroup 1 [uncultured Actinomycetospora sp.]|uniref:Oxidoreductase of aldo/keto reductase family, subgroup 1 n=1 Tax=uncultured Actinomycetospora sp. TaxID=1135996 RepID=A0A6J4H1E0_9PSEU|nr:MAG: oxidoreductase of aldo/keto reductase family, subgroup 1 [uncultured Actinomycetospora sp.]
MSDVPGIELNNGTTIPQLGFGVFQIDPSDTAEAVTTALEAGYRHIDTAQMYGNEAEVGEAIAKADIPRDQLWITTKCNNSNHGYDDAQSALDESLQKMGLDHVDLYLIHWPLPGKDLYVDTWKGFEKAQSDGKVRTIGVSNFQPHHLDRLLSETDTVPAVNQIELHPHMQQAGLRSYHERHGIRTEAWSPIGQGRGLLDAPELSEIAQAHGKSPAQVVLRWHVQIGNIVFPKSSTAERIRENYAIFDFELGDDEVETINRMEKAERLGPDPDEFDR